MFSLTRRFVKSLPGALLARVATASMALAAAPSPRKSLPKVAATPKAPKTTTKATSAVADKAKAKAKVEKQKAKAQAAAAAVKAKAAAQKAKVAAAKSQAKAKEDARKLQAALYTFKRPANPRSIFLGEQLKGVQAVKGAETSPFKAVSEKWKWMVESEKAPYVKASQIEQEVYHKQLATIPRKPPTSYGRFVSKNYKLIAQRINSTALADVTSVLSREWKGLLASEKASYKPSESEWKQYEQAKAAFESARKSELKL